MKVKFIKDGSRFTDAFNEDGKRVASIEKFNWGYEVTYYNDDEDVTGSQGFPTMKEAKASIS